MGLRKVPKPKQSAAADDLLQFLVTHLVHYDSVFADEKQRVYPLAGLNLSYISACRVVSLFDTRRLVDNQPDDSTFISSEGEATDKECSLSSPNSIYGQEVLGYSGYESCMDSDDSMSDEITQDDMAYDEPMEMDDNTQSGTDYESDCSSVTDDGYLKGDEKTRSILWRYIEFCIIRSPIPGHRNILAATVTLLHTKGEDRKPRI